MQVKIMSGAFLLCLLFTAIAPAQTRIRWEQGAPNADKVTIDSRVKKSLTLDGVTFWTSLAVQRLGTEMIYYDKFVVYAGLVNESDRRIEITPDMITVAVTKPTPKSIARETAAHLSNSIQWHAAMGGALGQLSANTATTQSQTSGAVTTSSGRTATYSGATTSPDYAARQRADRQATDLNRSASAAGADLVRLELKANTIMPGDAYAGMLIFQREKKCEEAIVTISIDGKVIEFPFTWLNKK